MTLTVVVGARREGKACSLTSSLDVVVHSDAEFSPLGPATLWGINLRTFQTKTVWQACFISQSHSCWINDMIYHFPQRVNNHLMQWLNKVTTQFIFQLRTF